MALNNQTQSTEDQEVQDLDFANKPSEVAMEPVADAAIPAELTIEEAQNVRMVSDDDQIKAEPDLATNTEIPLEDSTINRVDATIIGDAIEKGRDIRLPLIGHLSLQRQIRYLLIAMGTSLLLSAVFVLVKRETVRTDFNTSSDFW